VQTRAGQAIEDESMRIIESEVGDHGYPPDEWAVVRRVIHSTADFDFARSCAIAFFGDAVRAGAGALRAGATIVADVHGVTGLIGARHVRAHGNSVVCRVSEPQVAERAGREGTTRSRAAMRESAADLDGGVAVVGNAPTALLELLEMAREGLARPALTVGIPVGFVSAAESKEALAASGLTCITNSGRKGGSAAAAAVLNALYALG